MHKLLLSLCLLLLFEVETRADTSAGGRARLAVGQKEVTKNLIFLGPARTRDKKFVLKSYDIFAKPEGVLDFEFVATHLDGSTETFPAFEGRHKQVDRIFNGALDLRMRRKADDTTFPVDVYINRHTRTEGEKSFP